MFLIAVVSIVEGMGRYMEEDFAGRLLGANTFTLRRFPWFSNTTEAEWREWVCRPRLYHKDVRLVSGALPAESRWAVVSQDQVRASTAYVRPRPVEDHAVEGGSFT